MANLLISETGWQQVGELEVNYLTRGTAYVPAVVKPGESKEVELIRARKRLDELTKEN